MPEPKTGNNNSEIPRDIAGLSFEAALRELKDVVQRLEGGDVDLEESIEIYSRGTLLKRHCESKLQAAQAKVEKLIPPEPGESPSSEPFEPSSEPFEIE